LTQFFAVGTNQLCAAAFSFTLVPSRDVVFGMLPIPRREVIEDVLVWPLTPSTASPLSAPSGTARSEPPRKPGIGFPAVWLGVTNCFVTALLVSPTQQLNQRAPTIEAALPWAYTSYGLGWVSSVVLLAREAAVKKFL